MFDVKFLIHRLASHSNSHWEW